MIGKDQVFAVGRHLIVTSPELPSVKRKTSVPASLKMWMPVWASSVSASPLSTVIGLAANGEAGGAVVGQRSVGTPTPNDSTAESVSSLTSSPTIKSWRCPTPPSVWIEPVVVDVESVVSSIDSAPGLSCSACYSQGTR